VNIKYVVTAAVLLLFALLRAFEVRRAWAGRPSLATVHRTVAAQALVLAGAAIVVGVAASAPDASARPGPAALAVGAAGVVVVLAGALAGVLIALTGRPRFLIPPQRRSGPGPLAASAAGGQPGAPPAAAQHALTGSDEDALLVRAVGSYGQGASTAARHLRKNVQEISLTVHLLPEQAAARARQVIADLGALVQPGTPGDAGAVRVIGVIGAGALNMNPAVVTVTISPAGHESSVTVRGAAKEGLIKQRAGEDAARRVAAGLG
jgi:hypothetical protein